jgi:hypothetical protein
MSTAAQLLARIQAAALKGVAERLTDYRIDVADLRSLGVEDVLRIAFEAAAQVAFDVDTAEIPLPLSAPAPRPERTPSGTWLGPEEDTQPIGLNNRGQRV